MPVFTYKGYTAEGRIENGQLDTLSEAAAYDTLRAMGLAVVDLRDGAQSRPEPWYRREVRLTSGTLPLAEQAALAEQMAVLFRVRLPLLDILGILHDGADHRDTRARFARIRWLVSEGVTFPDAFAQAGPRVSPVFLTLLQMGHRSDAMPALMEDLADYLREQEKLQGKILGALLYPAVLIVATFGLLLIVTLSLAPALAPIFAGQDRPMPGGLAAFLTIGTVLKAHGAALGIGAVLAGLALYLLLRRVGSRLALRLPLIGPIMRDTALLRLNRALVLLLRAGWPLNDALQTCATLAPRDPFAPALRAASEALEKGGRAHGALALAGDMPSLFLDLFRIGEETNTLPEVLAAVSRSLADRTARRTQRLLAALTPALTLIIGGVIGLLITTIMGAVFSVNDLAF
ncbi:MAG: type II secretion system F family protein [Alphaproteobacteria bacterium]|nr:type II secretion system F family protein [Alphaproteobacteria bacterium]